MERRTIEDGKKFGKFTVIGYNKASKKYIVKCECGEVREYTSSILKNPNRGNGCFKCIQKQPRLHKRLPEDTALKRSVLDNYKRAAERRGYNFNLTEEEFFSLIISDCYYCGTSLSMVNNEQKCRGRILLYNGVDRKDNSIGYDKENCVPCCKICNNSKASLTLEEWNAWITRIYNFRQTK